MYRKLSILLLLILEPAFAGEIFNAGVSFDYAKPNNANVEKIQSALPKFEKKFIDLNYSIEYKPLALIDGSEYNKKTKNRFKTNLEFTPGAYEISLATGSIEGKSDLSSNLKQLLAKNPENKDLCLAYAIQLKKENLLQEAYNAAMLAIEADPDFSLAHFLAGDILREMKNYKQAVYEYLYAAQINPLCADAYYNVAKILELVDAKELALDYYKLAYLIDPKDDEIRDIILNSYIEL